MQIEHGTIRGKLSLSLESRLLLTGLMEALKWDQLTIAGDGTLVAGQHCSNLSYFTCILLTRFYFNSLACDDEQEAAKSELPAATMKLIHSGKVLKDADSIESCNIKPTDFLVVMITKVRSLIFVKGGREATPPELNICCC